MGFIFCVAKFWTKIFSTVKSFVCKSKVTLDNFIHIGFRLTLVQEADLQQGYSVHSSVGMVLDFSQYFDRASNLGSDATGTGSNNGGLPITSLQIVDAFWCERKNHKKKSYGHALSRKTPVGTQSHLVRPTPTFLDTTPCPMETMARNYLCVRFQVTCSFVSIVLNTVILYFDSWK